MQSLFEKKISSNKAVPNKKWLGALSTQARVKTYKERVEAKKSFDWLWRKASLAACGWLSSAF